MPSNPPSMPNHQHRVEGTALLGWRSGRFGGTIRSDVSACAFGGSEPKFLMMRTAPMVAIVFEREGSFLKTALLGVLCDDRSTRTCLVVAPYSAFGWAACGANSLISCRVISA